MYAIGELIYELAYSEAPDLAPYPSVADAFWLGSYLAVGTGIVLVLRSRLQRAFHATMWLDAAIGATTIAALAATLAFDPVLTDTAGYGWEVATDLAYPLADLGLLALVVTLLALTGWRPGLGWALFALALSASAVSDILYAREIALGTDGQDTLLAPVWPAATLLLAYAAWRPLDASPRSGMPLARVFIFPAGFTLLALAILVYDQSTPSTRSASCSPHRDRARRRADGAVVPRQPADAAARAPRRADRLAHRAAEPARVHGGARTRRWRAARRPSRGCSRCSTSTASSATTTPTGTRRATRCCSGSRAPSATSSTTTAARSGSAATSSAC